MFGVWVCEAYWVLSFFTSLVFWFFFFVSFLAFLIFLLMVVS